MTTDQLREEVNRLQEIIREQGETIEQQNDRIDELEDRNAENDESTEDETKDAQNLVEVRSDDEEADPKLTDIWIAGLPFGNIIDAIETAINGPGRITYGNPAGRTNHRCLYSCLDGLSSNMENRQQTLLCILMRSVL